MYSPRPHPSFMKPAGGCLPMFIIAVLCAVCWPLAIPALLIYGLWDGLGGMAKTNILGLLMLLAILFILAACPILCFISIFLDEYNSLPLSDTWWMWIVTIAEVIFVIYLIHTKRTNPEKIENFKREFTEPPIETTEWGRPLTDVELLIKRKNPTAFNRNMLGLKYTLETRYNNHYSYFTSQIKGKEPSSKNLSIENDMIYYWRFRENKSKDNIESLD